MRRTQEAMRLQRIIEGVRKSSCGKLSLNASECHLPLFLRPVLWGKTIYRWHLKLHPCGIRENKIHKPETLVDHSTDTEKIEKSKYNKKKGKPHLTLRGADLR